MEKQRYRSLNLDIQLREIGNSSKIPTLKKSAVRSVPDFAKLHKKWEFKIDSLKSKKNTNIPTSMSEKKSTKTVQLLHPIKPSSSSNSTMPKSTKSYLKSSKSVYQSSQAKKNPGLDQSNTALFQSHSRSAPNPKFKYDFDEFDNGALCDIITSTNADDLDAKENRRGSIWGEPTTRKSLGPPRRNTSILSKNAFSKTRSQPEEIKRASIFSGPTRVLKSSRYAHEMLNAAAPNTNYCINSEKTMNAYQSLPVVSNEEVYAKPKLSQQSIASKKLTKMDKSINEFFTRQVSSKTPQKPVSRFSIITHNESVLDSHSRSTSTNLFKKFAQSKNLVPSMSLEETYAPSTRQNLLPDPFQILESMNQEEMTGTGATENMLKTELSLLSDLEALLLKEIEKDQ